VSHLRPEDRGKPSRNACRKGRHHYGESRNIGAGIQRRVCDICGEVTIDLTGVEEVTKPVSRTTRRIGTLSSNDS
jgi:hypothetical protein